MKFMRLNYVIACLIAVAVAGIIGVVAMFNGDGGFKGMTTISGIYAVDKPQGYEVVCFVKKSSGYMDCLPTKALRGSD